MESREQFSQMWFTEPAHSPEGRDDEHHYHKDKQMRQELIEVERKAPTTVESIFSVEAETHHDRSHSARCLCWSVGGSMPCEMAARTRVRSARIIWRLITPRLFEEEKCLHG